MSSPKDLFVEKVVVNIGVGEAGERLVKAEKVLEMVTGQKPVETLSKTVNRDLGIREGMPLGCKVTLRGERMYEFMDKLMNIALPRVRDFHGVPRNSFDNQGNYSLGLKEQTVFPEITFEDASVLHGLEITFIIKNGSKEGSTKLLELFGMPFEKGDK